MKAHFIIIIIIIIIIICNLFLQFKIIKYH